jgi:hypothetical protein
MSFQRVMNSERPAEQISGGVSGAAAGGGAAGGLAILVALALPLLLLKKKEKKEDEWPEEIGEPTLGTIGHDDEYISEYGLSDAIGLSNSDEDREDLPQESTDDFDGESFAEYLSERNPDDVDPDES